MKKLTTKALSVQLTIVIIGGLLILSVFSIVTTYNSHIHASQEGVKSKLISITKTLSLSLNGDHHQKLVQEYKAKDAIKTSEEDSLYFTMHQLLKRTQVENNIPTDIYTLFFNSDKSKLCFGVTSGSNPYFRHEYESYPWVIKEKYEVGATIDPYMDEHGMWISGFSPIKNTNGETVGIIQCDIQFDSFIDEARSEMYVNISISLLVFLVITGIVLFIVRKLARIDEEKTQQLSDAFAQLKVKNKDITDSINYALRIQEAIIPKDEDIQPFLKDCFMFYEPKDVVSGDFPWFYKREQYLYFAAVDCTGHGVPGAMMSVIGCLLLNDIVNNKNTVEPGEMLNQLHQAVVTTLKQEENTAGTVADGMDLAMCRIDLENNEVQFAGAHRPLYHIHNGELTEIKGCKYPIGGAQYKGKNKFKNHIVKVKPGDSIYFFSDGLPDQFGGDLGRKFGPRRIREILLNSNQFSNLKTELHSAYLEWKGNEKQIDDILLIGVQF